VATQLGIEFAGLADQEPAERRRMLEEVLRLYLSEQHRDDPERHAWVLVASIVGAVTIARALPPGHQAEEVLDAVLASTMQSITDKY
jgi:TetR/AcrR family transcriptional repressor of nem operon